MDPRELKDRYQKLLEDYHSGVSDWKAFETGLLELKRARATLAVAPEDDFVEIPDTRGIERMRFEAELQRPNRFAAQGNEPSTKSTVSHRRDPGTSLAMSMVPASSFRVEPVLPSGEGSGILRSDSRIMRQIGNSLQIGTVLSERYTLQRSLGRGAFGETWRAKDETTDNYVVIKLLPSAIQKDTKVAGRFFEIFRHVLSLRHRNICPIYFLDEDDKHGVFLVSAYLDALSLEDYYSQYVRMFGEFPITAVVRVLWPVASALDFAREQRVLHRDLKPNNVLIGKTSGVMVTGFGLAEFVRTSLRERGVSVNVSDDKPWQAPEVWLEGRHGNQSDQFSLAVLAYRMIGGSLPFTGRTEAELREKIINAPPPLLESVSDDVNTALLQALAKNPFDRFPSCLHLVKALIEPAEQGAHYPRIRTRTLDARKGLWTLLFGIPKPEEPICVASETEFPLWPSKFEEETTATEGPDVRIPQRSAYPYHGTAMEETLPTPSVFASLAGTTTTVLGGLATVSVATGIAMTMLFGSSEEQSIPSAKVGSGSVTDTAPVSSAPISSVSMTPQQSSESALNDDSSSTVSADELVDLTERASKGDLIAQRKLGESYFNGNGVSTNYATAIRYFRQSAEKGDAASLYYLGRCNELGLGVPVNADLAKNYYTRAAKQGFREARLALRRLSVDLP